VITEFTIDRAKEREILLRNTTQGNHTLLLGRNGVGKTHLLIDLKRELRASDVALHYIPRPVPAKETIENIYAWLAMLAGVALPRKIGRDTRIADFCGFIAELLSHPNLAGRKIVLMVDDFDHLPALAVPIFEIIAERICLIGAARTRKGGARFNRLLWRFEEVRVELLSPQEARELTVREISTVQGIKLPNDRTREFLITRIATLSNGIPSAIIESVERLRGAEHIDEAYIREIFVHRSADTFFDATPLILAFFAFLVVMRYINRGMYQFDLYAIFGAISGLMLLARWFMMRTSRNEA
jgi:hypothetical protein